jgi:hypothetical protein
MFNPINLEELPNSSFNIVLGKRRSGKSYLTEYIIEQMRLNGQIDVCLLFTGTGAGFTIIDKESRFREIDKLNDVLENYRRFNEYNKVVGKSKQIKLKTVIILDDLAVDLKSQKFNILEKLSVNGRHLAYPPLSLHFFILAQSLTKIPRVVRLNSDNIFLNQIASANEMNLVLDENLYLLDGSLQGKREARSYYQDLVVSRPFAFCCLENWRQNVVKLSDFVKIIVAD